MNKVLILYGKRGRRESPFQEESHRISYEFFYALCEKKGIKMYRASYEWYDPKRKIFERAWHFDSQKKRWFTAKAVKPDLIFDKTPATSRAYYKKELIENDYPFFNSLEFTKLVRNKLTISMLFERWSKKSWLLSTKTELKKILSKIKTDKIVLKPIRGSGGNNIYILDKKEVFRRAVINDLYIAQEFIDSSTGVPGVSKEKHDLRLVLVNDKIIYSYIREPKSGSYLANCAQGGTLKIVPLKNIPKSVFPIVNYANKVFDTFVPRIYSIDVMFDEKKKPWVVELNAMPGLNLCAKEEKPYILKLYKELLNIFKQLTSP